MNYKKRQYESVANVEMKNGKIHFTRRQKTTLQPVSTGFAIYSVQVFVRPQFKFLSGSWVLVGSKRDQESNQDTKGIYKTWVPTTALIWRKIGMRSGSKLFQNLTSKRWGLNRPLLETASTRANIGPLVEINPTVW